MDILYISTFLFSIILFDWGFGKKATFYYLLIVLFGVIIVYHNKYSIFITTPEVIRRNRNSLGNGGGFTNGSGKGVSGGGTGGF